MKSSNRRRGSLRATAALVAMLAGIVPLGPLATSRAAPVFDQHYRGYRELLATHVVGRRVDYTSLTTNRRRLDAVVDQFAGVTSGELAGWTEAQQIAYWINAYNAFTLQAIVDHYPIRGSWLRSLIGTPRDSIKQIGGVWTRLRWRAGGRDLTLDEIEHETLRTDYAEPRIHFAVNCAAVSCPPLRREPYVGAQLERQLILAARDFLASDDGLQITDGTLHLSRIFSWYGDDFVDGYAHLIATDRSGVDRGILGVVATYGPREASILAQAGAAPIRFLRYDWSLNDTATMGATHR